jgi:signal transduction histidine kinase
MEIPTTNKTRVEPGLLATFSLFVKIEAVILTAVIVRNLVVHNNTTSAVVALFNLIATVLLLFYLALPALEQKLKVFYLPLGVIIATLIPILNNFYNIHIMVNNGSPEFTTSPWQMLPLMVVPLVAVAWQYTFREVFLYILSTGLFEGFIAGYLFNQFDPNFHPVIFYEAGRSVAFFIVGYIVSRLMATQREQRKELLETNLKLRQHASTLEQLAVSRERNRLARELHDTLAHTLSGLAIQLEAIQTVLPKDPAEAQTLLDQSLLTTRSGLTETRRALKDLRASSLDDLGLRLALENLARSAAARAAFSLNLNLEEGLDNLPPQIEQAIYRVAQEALENIVRHAQAAHVWLSLTRQGQQLCLLVRDDGRGFSPNQVIYEERMGIRGMTERAASIGGSLEINSQPGSDTTVRLQLEVSLD